MRVHDGVEQKCRARDGSAGDAALHRGPLASIRWRPAPYVMAASPGTGRSKGREIRRRPRRSRQAQLSAWKRLSLALVASRSERACPCWMGRGSIAAIKSTVGCATRSRSVPRRARQSASGAYAMHQMLHMHAHHPMHATLNHTYATPSHSSRVMVPAA